MKKVITKKNTLQLYLFVKQLMLTLPLIGLFLLSTSNVSGQTCPNTVSASPGPGVTDVFMMFDSAADAAAFAAANPTIAMTLTFQSTSASTAIYSAPGPFPVAAITLDFVIDNSTCTIAPSGACGDCPVIDFGGGIFEFSGSQVCVEDNITMCFNTEMPAAIDGDCVVTLNLSTSIGPVSVSSPHIGSEICFDIPIVVNANNPCSTYTFGVTSASFSVACASGACAAGTTGVIGMPGPPDVCDGTVAIVNGSRTVFPIYSDNINIVPPTCDGEDGMAQLIESTTNTVCDVFTGTAGTPNVCPATASGNAELNYNFAGYASPCYTPPPPGDISIDCSVECLDCNDPCFEEYNPTATGNTECATAITPPAPPTATTTEYTICEGDAIPDFEVDETTAGTPPTACVTNWFDAPTAGTMVSTGTTFNSNGATGEETTTVDTNTPGTYTFYAEADCNGCTSDTRTQIVLIIEDTAPQCMAQDITVTLDGTGNATVAATDIDNGSMVGCLGGTLALSLDPTTFTCDDVGPNTVTLTVDDGNGNSSTCTAIVTIEPDTTCTNPSFDCPPTQTACTGESFNCNPTEPGGTYGGTAGPFVINDILDPTSMPPGDYTLTYTVNGVTSEVCEFTVVAPPKGANAGSLSGN